MELPKKGTIIAGVPFDPRKSGRYFEYIVYQDSAPQDWRETLKNLGYIFCVSPLHDKDVTGQNEPKKPHWHLLVAWNNSTKWQTATAVCDVTNGPICIPVSNLRTKYDYLTHKNDPNKAQYDPRDIEHFNGFCLSNYEGLHADEIRQIVANVTNFCFEEHITEYAELVQRLLQNQQFDEFDVVSNRTLYFSQICKGIWRKGGDLSPVSIDPKTGEVLTPSEEPEPEQK